MFGLQENAHLVLYAKTLHICIYIYVCVCNIVKYICMYVYSLLLQIRYAG